MNCLRSILFERSHSSDHHSWSPHNKCSRMQRIEQEQTTSTEQVQILHDLRVFSMRQSSFNEWRTSFALKNDKLTDVGIWTSTVCSPYPRSSRRDEAWSIMLSFLWFLSHSFSYVTQEEWSQLLLTLRREIPFFYSYSSWLICAWFLLPSSPIVKVSKNKHIAIRAANI